VRSSSARYWRYGYRSYSVPCTPKFSADRHSTKLWKVMTVTRNDEKTVRAVYQYWPDADRTGLEELIAEGVHFTSPLDNRLDRGTFFTRCWPNSANMAATSSSSSRKRTVPSWSVSCG
jgi:hypothetical protein